MLFGLLFQGTDETFAADFHPRFNLRERPHPEITPELTNRSPGFGVRLTPCLARDCI